MFLGGYAGWVGSLGGLERLKRRYRFWFRPCLPPRGETETFLSQIVGVRDGFGGSIIEQGLAC